jgi:hypothetical protein
MDGQPLDAIKRAQEIICSAMCNQHAAQSWPHDPLCVEMRQAVSHGDAIVTALHQYRNDMLYPPAPDSRERRVAMIDALTGAAP